MKDTAPKTESLFTLMLMKKSGEERIKMGFSMFEMARRQIIASLQTGKPHAYKREIRKAIFMRLYGQEFTGDELRKIIGFLNN